MTNKTIKGYLFAIISAIIYGSMPLMARHIYADGVTPMTLVFLRNAVSLLPLGLLAYRERHTLKIPLKQLPQLGIISILGCALTPILLFTGYQYIDSGMATVFHFVYPAIVVVAEILFLRKKAKWSNVAGVALCVIGISFFYAPGQTPNLAGSVLALSSGLTFATYVVLLGRFDRSRVSGYLFTFYVVAISSALLLVVCLATNTLVLPASFTGWGLCVLFSLLVTLCAVTMFQQSAFLIGSQRASILSALEPITSVVIGVIAFQETIGIRKLAGSALVVSASILIAIFDYRSKKA